MVPTGTSAATAVAAAIAASVTTTTNNTAAPQPAKGTLPSSSSLTNDPDLMATMALVTFLRAEADAADKKAKSFRKQAAQLAIQFGINDNVQQLYEKIDAEQLPPLDENGVPKYRGKKRGRKRKAKMRQANPNRAKRQHTGYTFFMQDQYPKIKAMHPVGYPSKDIISAVATEWKSFSPLLKAEWKQKAIAAHQLEQQEQSALVASTAQVASINNAGDDDDDDDEEEEEEREEEDVIEEDDDDDDDDEELDEEENGMDDTTPSGDDEDDDTDNAEEDTPSAARRKRA